MADLINGLPFSLEAEQSVLGSILIDPECFTDVTAVIKAEDFYISEHAEMFSAMLELFRENREIDLVTLIDKLVTGGVYGEDDSRKYIKVIADTVPSAANVRDYANIVREKSIRRSLIAAADKIKELAMTSHDGISDIVDYSEQLIFEIAKGKDQKSFIHIKDAVMQTFDRLQQLRTDKEAALGTPTGFSGLDSVLVGMGAGDFILVGARPGVGKTSFALNIAANVAKKRRQTVCVFSLEMSAEQLAARVLSSEALVDSNKIRSGTLGDDDWFKLGHAADTLAGCDILIDDSVGSTVTSMKAKLRRVKNLGLVVVDYLQLMQGDRQRDNRVLEVGDISRGLKLLAKELGVPCICCSQLSRSAESDKPRKPMLSDLRESGSQEQDADVIMFLSRDYYQTDPDKLNTAECIIAKNRHGATGTVQLGWFPQFTKFTTQETVHTEAK